MISPILPNIKTFRLQIHFSGKTNSAKIIDFQIYNPYTLKFYNQDISIDLNKPQKIIMNKANLELDYNPERTGYLWDKKEKKPIKVNILKNEKNYNSIFFFMSPDLKHQYGYTHIAKFENRYQYQYSCIYEELVKDYPEQEIFGPRVIVEYTKNWDDKNIGGVGKLADKIAVKYCIDNNINFNIISMADKGSHVAHFKRGKRFLPLDSYASEYYLKRYGISDINKILEKLIDESNGQPVNISGWGMKPIYMPKDVAKRYEKEIITENNKLI